jgi:exonuclease SbcC
MAGDWVDISGSTAGYTNSKIEDLIKLEYKTFINSVYFRQNDISEFAEAEPSRKKEILKSIIDISRWDSYEKAAKKLSKDISDECKVLVKSTESYDEQYQSLIDLRAEIEDKKSVISSLGKDIASLAESKRALSRRYDEIKNSLDTDTYDRVIDDLEKLREQRAYLIKSEASQQSQIEETEKEAGRYAELVGKLKDFLASKETIEVSESEIQAYKDELISLKAEKKSCEEFVASLDEISITPDQCYVCKQGIDEDLYSKLVRDIEGKKSDYNDKKVRAINLIIEHEEKLNALQETVKINKKIALAEEKLSDSEPTLELLNSNCDKQRERLGEISDKLRTVMMSIETNIGILNSIKREDFQEIRKKLRETEEKETKLKEAASLEDRELGRLIERESLLKEAVDKILEDKKKVTSKMEKASLFVRLSKMFGKNGIQSILLDAIIEDLEKTSNITLSSICNEPATIVLETQRVGSDGSSLIETLDLKVRKDGNLQSFKSLSGGEKFRISLALRIALSEISSRYGGSSLEFLLLDEVNSPLDRFGVETLFVNVIKSLEEKYKIMVITHDESLKEKFDNIIDSTKINGDTEIVFTRR